MSTATAHRLPAPSPRPARRAKPLPRRPRQKIRLRSATGSIRFEVGESIDLVGFGGQLVGSFVVRRATPGFGTTSTSLSLHLVSAPEKPKKPVKKKPASRRPSK